MVLKLVLNKNHNFKTFLLQPVRTFEWSGERRQLKEEPQDSNALPDATSQQLLPGLIYCFRHNAEVKEIFAFVY